MEHNKNINTMVIKSLIWSDGLQVYVSNTCVDVMLRQKTKPLTIFNLYLTVLFSDLSNHNHSSDQKKYKTGMY